MYILVAPSGATPVGSLQEAFDDPEFWHGSSYVMRRSKHADWHVVAEHYKADDGDPWPTT